MLKINITVIVLGLLLALQATSYATTTDGSLVSEPKFAFCTRIKRCTRAGYCLLCPAYIYVHFMDGQMWQLIASLWEDDVGGLNYPFDDLNKLLTGKYGPVSRNESYNLPVHSLPKPVPITKFVWSINGDAKTITLNKRPTFTSGHEKILGSVSVTYANLELYNALRNKARQNI